ncbi:hypothetical protein K505DRAFT_419118 [Melanomma pulvis-pyrius CBS 109.77]|uniref:Ring-like domain-containing protein n=1 Tax=Melanomma pulvis-pyrius CBS 109.77 TaxID=1314802 RepID=A0A6A6X5P8_9PLEO|nr:hypothetical protein K505DRAFT_419118 [Melanomma pulvis-pyrius CBS 109.77]
MSLSYFNVKKLRRQSKQHDSVDTAISPVAAAVTSPSEEPATSPVLDEEDERFLERLAAIAQEPEGTPPPLPNRPVVILDGGEKKVEKDAQEALMAGADKVPLPMSPPDVGVEDGAQGKEKAVEGDVGRKKGVMSYFALAQSRFKRAGDKYKDEQKEKKKDKSEKQRDKAANDLHAAAESSKSPEQTEAEKEQEDLTNILDQLNLSAVNNRVFSFSKESEELLNKFKVVLKDIVNGAPTAYNDLEKLLTGSEEQLKKMYGTLPPFLQNLVKSLPAKMTAALGPEILAAQAEKPGFDAKQRASASGIKAASKKARMPSLKTLVSAEGAVATMLRSILSFLKLRFPMLMSGTNVLMSLAVFLLLFVFWYCHKRGREVRLEAERLAAEGGDPALDSSASFTDDSSSFLEESTEAGSSKKKGEKAEPPLIIHDNKEEGAATVNDMPSVLHLPDPKSVPLPETVGNTPLKEEPLKVPVSK